MWVALIVAVVIVAGLCVEAVVLASKAAGRSRESAEATDVQWADEFLDSIAKTPNDPTFHRTILTSKTVGENERIGWRCVDCGEEGLSTPTGDMRSQLIDAKQSAYAHRRKFAPAQVSA